MVRSLVRALVFALLALIVPLQGVASVMAGQCMAFGHHDAGHGNHEHDGHDDHEHGMDQEQSSHCGPCAACCASASIAAPAIGTLVPLRTNTQHFFAQLAPPEAEPQRFDRPPLRA